MLARSAACLPLALVMLAALAGCARNVKLHSLPGTKGGYADVHVLLTYNRNDEIEIVLRAPDPSSYGANYTRYVVWVATPDRKLVTNAGQIRVEKGRGRLRTLTALHKFWVSITVEERGDTLGPSGPVVFQTSSEIEW